MHLDKVLSNFNDHGEFQLHSVSTCVIFLKRAGFYFRREVYHTQRELLRERTRCKALEEELENPMNIHRWRKLEVGTFCIKLIMRFRRNFSACLYMFLLLLFLLSSFTILFY